MQWKNESVQFTHAILNCDCTVRKITKQIQAHSSTLLIKAERNCGYFSYFLWYRWTKWRYWNKREHMCSGMKQTSVRVIHVASLTCYFDLKSWVSALCLCACCLIRVLQSNRFGLLSMHTWNLFRNQQTDINVVNECFIAKADVSSSSLLLLLVLCMKWANFLFRSQMVYGLHNEFVQ